MGVILHHLKEFLRHIGEFLDNGTQFTLVKELIGSASLVWGWSMPLREPGSVLDQFGGVVRHWERVVLQIEVVLHQIGEFLRHIGKFLDNETQFSMVKELIGSASLV